MENSPQSEPTVSMQDLAELPNFILSLSCGLPRKIQKERYNVDTSIFEYVGKYEGAPIMVMTQRGEDFPIMLYSGDYVYKLIGE